MHLLVSLIALPFALVVSTEETSAPQGAAVRSSLTRSFRHRPPTIITPHVFKVFDARIAVSRSYLMLIVVLFGLVEHVVDFYRSHSSQKAEILGVKSKYRDAERILRGVGLSPLIELPDVYESKGGWEGHIGNSTCDLDPSSNHTFDDMDMHGDGLGAFWIDDLMPRVENRVSTAGTSSDYPGGKRRCSDEKGGDNGTVCDLAPAGTNGEPRVEARSTPSATITPDMTIPNIPLPEPGQNSDQMDSAHMKVVDYIVGGLDVLYYGGLGFGSPSQEIMLDVDTGSADLWVSLYASYKWTVVDFSIRFRRNVHPVIRNSSIQTRVCLSKIPESHSKSIMGLAGLKAH
ncbi:hypothetical protein FRC12_017103 [Ceratobasidium sp. 428]|nr:hypothetical protein FRC12_017103 [Ceratobasidium sp. 428]